jgi:serine protease Do
MCGDRTSLLLSALLTLLIPSASLAQVGKESSLWKWTSTAEHHDSIVQVSCGGGIGTGVIIDVARDKPVGVGFEGLCITAYHVVEPDDGKREIEVKYKNGRVSEKALIVEFDKKRDVAMLWVWVPAGIKPAVIAARPAGAGDRLEFSGLGGGSKLDCCIRHFSANASAPTTADEILSDVPLLPGDSGGPVFNDRHELVGIISGGWFWWDGGIRTDAGNAISVTWPGRACNVAVIKRVRKQAPQWYANRLPAKQPEIIPVNAIAPERVVDSGDGTTTR